jgi:hypothetical protein
MSQLVGGDFLPWPADYAASEPPAHLLLAPAWATEHARDEPADMACDAAKFRSTASTAGVALSRLLA